MEEDQKLQPNIGKEEMKYLQIAKKQLVALIMDKENPQYQMQDGTLYRSLSKAELASSTGVWLWAPRETLVKDALRFCNG